MTLVCLILDPFLSQCVIWWHCPVIPSAPPPPLWRNNVYFTKKRYVFQDFLWWNSVLSLKMNKKWHVTFRLTPSLPNVSFGNTVAHPPPPPPRRKCHVLFEWPWVRVEQLVQLHRTYKLCWDIFNTNLSEIGRFLFSIHELFALIDCWNWLLELYCSLILCRCIVWYNFVQTQYIVVDV